MTRVLQFRDLERDTSSYYRADRATAIIRRLGRYRFAVTLLDRDDPTTYRVGLSRDSRAWHGECECGAHRFYSPPCAHLWAVKQANERAALDLYAARDGLGRNADCPTCGQPTPEVDRAEA